MEVWRGSELDDIRETYALSVTDRATKLDLTEDGRFATILRKEADGARKAVQRYRKRPRCGGEHIGVSAIEPPYFLRRDLSHRDHTETVQMSEKPTVRSTGSALVRASRLAPGYLPLRLPAGAPIEVATRATERRNRLKLVNRNRPPRIHVDIATRRSAERRHRRIRCIEENVAVDPDVEPVSHLDLDRRLDVQVAPGDLRAQF